MLKRRLLKAEISEGLSLLLAALAALLLIASTLGCSHAPAKRKNEIWLVDEASLVLYRVTSENEEQAIPIQNNSAMKRFMCLDKDEVDYWIEELVDE